MIRVSTVLLVWLFMLSGCTQMLFRKAEKHFVEGVKDKPYDAVIVPGYPFNGSNWDRVLKMRIHWAKFLFEKGYTQNIIFSGSAVATPFVESKVMKSYAVALGIPEENIFVETNAEHSTENVYYSYRLAQDLGFEKIALATDPYQNSYMTKFVRRFELPIGFVPTVLDTLRSLDMHEPHINTEEERVQNFVKLSDREGFFERFRGTLGKHIVWHETDLKKKKFKRKFKNRMVASEAITKEP